MASKSKIEAAQLSLPKGGGSLQGMGEAFSPQTFSGSAGFSIPLPEAAGRGLSPSLSLAYSSSAGNGTFGLGFHLGLPSVTRKTSRALPHYDGTDAFECDLGELVRQLDQDLQPVVATKEWRGRSYRVADYRPRIEGSHAETQHWVDVADGTSFWRIRSSDDHVTYLGLGPLSRICNPAQPSQVFQWLVDEEHDDKGNVIRYHYKAEDGTGVPDSIYEAGRDHSAQRYPIRIDYGNYGYKDGGADRVNFSFQLVFDYGQVSLDDPSATDGTWACRPDPFSNYHPRFEVRTLRRCRRVLLYHQFHDQNGGTPFLVQAVGFHYGLTTTGMSQMESVVETGYRLQADGSYWAEAIPALRLGYTPFSPEVAHWQEMEVEGGEMLAGALGREGFLPVDLHGEGLPGMLYAHAGVTQYFAPMGEGRYAPADTLLHFPIDRDLGEGRARIASVNGNGRKDLVVTGAGRNGFYPASDTGRYAAWRSFAHQPAELDTEHAIVDLSGRGMGDCVVFDAPYLRFYPAQGSLGYGPPQLQELAPDFPAYSNNYREEVVDFLDILGDGLQHRVRIRAGSVEVWPNLGYGKFGNRIQLGNAPQFDGTLDVSRLHFADIDGSGTADFIYVHTDHIAVYFNLSGNQFSEALRIPLPRPYDDLCQVNFMDVRGNGTTCMVLSHTHPAVVHHYLDFSHRRKPYLLDLVDNGMGLRTRLHYSSSVQQYLQDKRNGRPWPTRLFFPVHVVTRIETREFFNHARHVQRFAYHDGYYDAVEREFRGFGFSESWDTDHYEKFTPAEDIPGWEVSPTDEALHVWPTYTKSWYHTGAYEDNALVNRQYEQEYWAGDAAAFPSLRSTLAPELLMADGDTCREAFVALAGQLLRSEVYGLDHTGSAGYPYTVSESAAHVRLVQPRAGNRHAVFQVDAQQSLSYAYDRNPQDPLVTQSLVLAVDAYGHDLLTAAVAYPRRDQAEVTVYPEQQVLHVSLSQQSYINVLLEGQPDPLDDCRLLGLDWEGRDFQVHGIAPANGAYFTLDDLRTQVAEALQAIIPSHEPFGDGPQARLQGWSRTYYWNADQTAAEAGGVAHKRALVHHEETAEMADAQAQRLYAGRFQEGELDAVLNKEAGYWLSDGYWWNRGLIQYYATEPTAFYVPTKTDNGFADVPAGSSLEHLSTVAYDPYWLLIASTTVHLDGGVQLTTTVVNDYIAMASVQSTDPNGTVSQVLLDPLGKAYVSSVHGSEGGKPVGDMDLGDYARLPKPTKEQVLTDPAQYLQGAGAYFFYDFFAYECDRQPPCAISVTRQAHAAVPTGQQASAPLQLVIAYSDGLGRSLVAKAQNGRDWHCTGRTVYDGKGQPCEQYLPYTSPSADYVPQEQFMQGERVVPPAVVRYDPLGRVTRTDTPKGFFTREVYSPWMQQHWDANDTVKEAPYYLANINNTTPAFADERDALQKAAVHYGTPSTVIHDNLGHTIRSIASNLGQVDADDLDPIAVTIGATGSDLFAAIVQAGYLGTAGWVLPAFKPYEAGFSLELPVPYDAVAQQVTDYLLQSCLTTFTRNDIKGRALLTMDPRLYYAHVQSGQEAANFEWVYAMEGDALLTVSADAGTHLVLDNIYSGLCYAWDARGFTTRAAYDRLQRPMSKHVQGTDAQGLSLDQVVELTVYGERVADAAKWNLLGKVYKHYGEDGLTTYPAYSIHGGPSRVEQRLRPGYKTEVAWDKAAMKAIEKEPAWVMTYLYNMLGQATANTLPDGSVVEVGFGEGGKLDTVSHMPKGGKMTAYITDISYDANSQRTHVRYANGVQTRYTYEDTTLRLLRIVSSRLEPAAGGGKPQVRVLQDQRYTYDPAGNVTRCSDDAIGQFFTFAAPASPLSDYTYDPLYQLVAATGPLHSGYQPQQVVTAPQEREGKFVPFKPATPRASNQLQQYTQQYRYDNGGNLLQLSHTTQGGSHWVRAYGIAADSNRLSTLGWQKLKYDAGGNALTMGLYPLIGWDFRNNIHQVQVLQRKAAAPDAEYYVYDSDGARVRKVWERMQHGGKAWEVEEKRYFGHYEEKRIWHRTEKGAQLLLHRKTVRLMDGDSAFATIDTWETDVSGREVKSTGKVIVQYNLQDQQDSTHLVLGAQGELRSYEGYLPYGETAFRAADKHLEQWTQDYGYSGKERDGATGLIYYGFRYYPPWLCRWMNPDPGGTVDGMNLYAFVGGNPVTDVDADGRMRYPTKKYAVKDYFNKKAGNDDFLDDVQDRDKSYYRWGSAAQQQAKKDWIKKKLKRKKGTAYTKGELTFLRALRRKNLFTPATKKGRNSADASMGAYISDNLGQPGFPDEETFYKMGGTHNGLSATNYAIEYDPAFAKLKQERDDLFHELKLHKPKYRDSKTFNKYKKGITALYGGGSGRKSAKQKRRFQKYQREWLHGQAVSLGGGNNSPNLQVGAYGANRTMEGLEQALAHMRAKKNRKTYGLSSLTAKVTSVLIPNTLIATHISYTIYGEKEIPANKVKGKKAPPPDIQPYELALDINANQLKFPTGSGFQGMLSKSAKAFFSS